MIKKYTLLVIFQFLLLKCYSQEIYDDVKISVCANTPAVFYEGQCLYLTYCIENLSNKEKPYHRRLNVWIDDFRNKSGEEIKNQYFEKSGLKTYKLGMTSDTPPSMFERMPPNCKYSTSMELRDWGNLNFTHILNISDSVYYWPNSEATLPYYLKQGEYIIKLKGRLQNTNNTIWTNYNIKVLPAEGDTRVQLLAYLNAYKGDLHTKVDGLKITHEPQLITFLKKYPKSVYATEVFRLLTLEYDYVPHNVIAFRKSNKNMFYLFETLPTLTSYQSESTVYLFLSAFTGDINGFEKDGLIQDTRTYIDSYLKRIQHLSPFASAIMIEMAENNLNILGLKNYAQEREDLETAKKNNKG